VLRSFVFFFSSRRRHTRCLSDWSSDVCSSDLDPDRRASGRRTTRVESFAPSLADLDGLRRRNPQAAIKLAPATEVPGDWSDAAEIGRASCRERVWNWKGGG